MRGLYLISSFRFHRPIVLLYEHSGESCRLNEIQALLREADRLSSASEMVVVGEAYDIDLAHLFSEVTFIFEVLVESETDD